MKPIKVFAGALLLAVTMFAVGTLRPLDARDAAANGSGIDSAPVSREDPSAALERKIAAGQANARDLAVLALTYLDRVRSEADPTLILRAQELIDKSFDSQPTENFAALVASASLANVSHDFSGSVRWSRRAARVNPYNAAPYGLLGDALFELGHYKQADAAYQRMVDTRPNVGSYVRAAYAAEFRGDYRAALKDLRLALRATSPVGEEAAYLHHQIGDVFYAERRFARSKRENRTGMRAAPGYTPPTVGVAEALIAEGKLRSALPIMQEAVENIPSIEYYVTLGNIHWALGDRSEARDAYDKAAARLRIYRTSGVKPDIDFILFYADHGIRLRAGLAEARAIYKNRPTAFAADALAWMLHATNHEHAAARYSGIALKQSRLPHAGFNFHAGAIAASLGQRSVAVAHLRRAFDIDPEFSLFHQDRARALMRRLKAHRPGVR